MLNLGFSVLNLGFSDGPAVCVEISQRLSRRWPVRETQDITPTTTVVHDVVWSWCVYLWNLLVGIPSSSGRLSFVFRTRKNWQNYHDLESFIFLSLKKRTNYRLQGTLDGTPCEYIRTNFLNWMTPYRPGGVYMRPAKKNTRIHI